MNKHHTRRYLGMALALLVLVIGSCELDWRTEATLLMQVPSPNGATLAEIRAMPESSELPYGKGVFLRDERAVLHSYQSHLVFAGYCNHVDVDWKGDGQIDVHCALREKEPLIPETRWAGVRVNVHIDRSGVGTTRR